MDFNEILVSLIGTSPFTAFLIWYILDERKTKKEDKEYNRRKYDETVKKLSEEKKESEKELKDDKRELQKELIQILVKNHDVLSDTQNVLKALAEKYDDLKKIVEKGFTETNKDIKILYEKMLDHDY